MDVSGTQRLSLSVSLDELTALVRTRLKRMQYRPDLINSLLAKTGLDLQPPKPQPLKISRTESQKAGDFQLGSIPGLLRLTTFG